MSSVAVIICSYTRERLDLLREAVASVPALPGAEVETVIVVDHNQALEAELRAEFKAATVVPNSGRRGLSGARNSGVEATSADLVAFLDDDAVADDRWLANLTGVFADPEVMAAGGVVLPDFAVERPRWWPEEFNWVVGCTYKGQLPEGQSAPLPVRNMIGASMMIRRSALDEVGGFNSDLGRVGSIPLGGEETELSIRIGERFGDGSVMLVPDSLVSHHVPANRLTLRYLHRRCYAEGLSKAVLTRSVGAASGLSSEARFLTSTIPRGILHELRNVLRGDVNGLLRAGVLLSATFATGLGWLRATASGYLSRSSPEQPSRVAPAGRE